MSREEGFHGSAGTHVAVRRPGRPWEHHGIVLESGEVFEVHRLPGLGMEVRNLPFDEFADGSPVRVVPHGRSRLRDTYAAPAAAEPTVVLGRVETLRIAARRGLLGRYGALGCNCEHLVNWCMAGDLDSTQVRKMWFGQIGLALDAACFIYLGATRHERWRPRTWATAVVAVRAVGGIAVVVLIQRRIWKLSMALSALDRERREALGSRSRR